MSTRIVLISAAVACLVVTSAAPEARARHSRHKRAFATHQLTQSGQPLVNTGAKKPVMVKAMGYHRRRDSGIWVWRGNKKKMRTLVHELLHRATRNRPQDYHRQIKTLTNDPKIDEGLTSYFTSNALTRTGRSPSFPDPQPGANFSQLRQWSRGIRAEAKGIIRQAYGVEVDTKKIAVLSDRCFGRCYQRDFSKPWVSRPGQPGVYGNSKSRVQQMVDLVGERPVRQAYLVGDVAGLRQALQRAQRFNPTALPSWVNLSNPPPAPPSIAGP